MMEPTVIVLGRGRKRGRPRASEPGSAVMTWLPASEHQRLIKLAEKRGESVSSTVRLLLRTKSKP